MKAENIREIKENEVLRKRLAKYMALRCFRNSELENLHAGKVPQSTAGDFTDVNVVFPGGEIPWNKLSRLNNWEMKLLMINVVNLCHDFLNLLYTAPQGDRMVEWMLHNDAVPEWQDPDLNPPPPTTLLKR